MLNTILRDVFISTLHSKSILDRLFEDDIPLDRTLEIASEMEKATEGVSAILKQCHKLDINSKPIIQCN